MPKVRIMETTPNSGIVLGGKVCIAGNVVEVDDELAKNLVWRGRAEIVPAETEVTFVAPEIG